MHQGWLVNVIHRNPKAGGQFELRGQKDRIWQFSVFCHWCRVTFHIGEYLDRVVQ